MCRSLLRGLLLINFTIASSFQLCYRLGVSFPVLKQKYNQQISLRKFSSLSNFVGVTNRETKSSSIVTVSCSKEEDIMNDISFRLAEPDDIAYCLAIETASYPSDEAATESSLKYRQSHATPYFQCALKNGSEIIGFICSTRCSNFDHETMTTHDPNGSLLAIHSVVVKEEYRRKGIASQMMKNYIKSISDNQTDPSTSISKIVLLAKSHLLGFYVNLGFSVSKVSDIVHGQEQWYDLEMNLVRDLPLSNERWFVKTEQFSKPFPEVKPHLEEHRSWVSKLRSEGYCITSGYRVDSEGKPGGGGMMFFTAKNYDDALALVKNDPLIANDCVDWRLNGWIAEVGDIQLR